MNIQIDPLSDVLCSELVIPADKSISHRALILNSLARGEARVSNLLEAEDVFSTMHALQGVGVSIRKEDEHLRIVRLAGKVDSNTALLDAHFNNFIATLEESNLFQNIEIMNQSSKAFLGKNSLQFELKCVI